MAEPFDVYDYAGYLRAHWKFFAIACGSALALALVVSLLLPQEYTATVTLVIEPGGDPRSASVVSPGYLESLKTYEAFAKSDVIFQRASDEYHLRAIYPDTSLESLKKTILEVTKLRDTRILQISATLSSPRDALGFAQFVAEQTIRLNQNVSKQAEQDAVDSSEKEFTAARDARDRATAEWSAFKERGSIDALQEEITNLLDLRTRIHRQLMAANVDVAGLESAPPQTVNARNDLAAGRAKASLLAHQYAEVTQEFERKNHYVAQTIAQRENLQDRLEDTRKAYQRTEDRVQELRGAVGFHGERLRVIDTGAVPTRPSSPKTVRNMEAALILSLVVALVYLSTMYTSQRRSNDRSSAYHLRA